MRNSFSQSVSIRSFSGHAEQSCGFPIALPPPPALPAARRRSAALRACQARRLALPAAAAKVAR
jgi:hypothetical protein